MSKIIIIIPCYNEEGNIKELLEEIKNTSKNTTDIWQPVVINDCSTDNTSVEASNFKGTIVLNLPVNLGIGSAVQTGLLFAKKNNADYAIKLDGDGQHNPEEINSLITPLAEKKADISIGSRFIEKNNGYRSSFLRRIGIKIIEFVCRILIKERITDPTSGFRAYNKKAIEFMCENYPSFDYPEPEELVLSAKNDIKLIEIPVKMRERKRGKSSITFYNSFYYMLKVILAMVITALRKV